MKKLLAIMMALVMCCSLVVSASAAEYNGINFDIDIDVDGEWEEYEDDGYCEYIFTSTYSELSIEVYTEEALEGYTSTEFYDLMKESFIEEGLDCEEGDLYGYDSFVAEYTEEDGFACYVFTDIDGAIVGVELISVDADEYDSLTDSIINMTIYDYAGEEIVDDEDVDVDEDKDEDVDVDDEEIVEDEDEDKKDDKEDKDNKSDKEEKEDKDADKEDEDEEKDNTTLIIIVAGVAVVAVAAVVIVLVTKKKK